MPLGHLCIVYDCTRMEACGTNTVPVDTACANAHCQTAELDVNKNLEGLCPEARQYKWSWRHDGVAVYTTSAPGLPPSVKCKIRCITPAASFLHRLPHDITAVPKLGRDRTAAQQHNSERSPHQATTYHTQPVMGHVRTGAVPQHTSPAHTRGSRTAHPLNRPRRLCAPRHPPLPAPPSPLPPLPPLQPAPPCCCSHGRAPAQARHCPPTAGL